MNDETPDILTPSSSGETSPRAGPGGEPVTAKKKRSNPRAAAAALEARIGYQFSDTMLRATAFTHVSALKAARKRGDSYQRLEFLGDHVLGLIVSDMLYRAFPKANEGELSKRLADLVRKESCADVATSLGLADDIKLGAVGAAVGIDELADFGRLTKAVRVMQMTLQARRGVGPRSLGCEQA